MKNCLRITEIASDAKERKLTAREKLRLNTHLMLCPGCRAFTKNTETLSQMMQSFKSQNDT